jgi:hypothetical protein
MDKNSPSPTSPTDLGPLRVSSNGRYFVDRKDQPFFWLGDTQWQLLRDFSLEDAEAILKDRASKGFTVLQVMVTGVGDGTRPNLVGQAPWLDNNPATPNPAYFERADAIVRLARHYPLPVIDMSCPRKELNQRIVMKEILARLRRMNRQVRENIYRAAWNINREYLPASGLSGRA